MPRRVLLGCVRCALALVLLAAASEKFLRLEEMGLRLGRVVPSSWLSPIAGVAVVALAGFWEALLALGLLGRAWRRSAALLAAITMTAYVGVIFVSPAGQCPCGEWATQWFATGRTMMISRNLVLAALGVAVYLCGSSYPARVMDSH